PGWQHSQDRRGRRGAEDYRRLVPGERPEDLAQGAEPFGVRPPDGHAVAIERAADLLAARRAYHPVEFVELEHGGVPRKTEIVERAADLVFRTLDQPLVVDVIHQAGRDAVEMGHQADVVDVALADVA